jgi:hypothetical protein
MRLGALNQRSGYSRGCDANMAYRVEIARNAETAVEELYL